MSSIRGTAAVEFAMIVPVMFLMLFGIIGFGVVLSTYNAVQQIAADAARAGLAGITATEQNQLAQAYVTSTISAYGFLVPTNLTMTALTTTTTFEVTVTYNMSGSFVFGLGGVFTNLSPQIVRSATIQLSGY